MSKNSLCLVEMQYLLILFYMARYVVEKSNEINDRSDGNLIVKIISLKVCAYIINYLLLTEDDFVVHVLKNRQIVGGSRAEDHMSRCAMQDVFELHQNYQEPAAHCQPLSEVKIIGKKKIQMYDVNVQCT